MISVIIPLYNKAGYIKKAIQSVLGQSYPDLELIIINDGSTDRSLEEALTFNDERIRIINQDNAGVSAARNNGVKAARNEYIAFLDADDWWDPDYLEEMRGLISKYPDAGLWAAKYYKVKYGKRIEANIGLHEGFTDGYINYFKVYAETMWMPLTSSSFIIFKPIFEELGGYNENLKFGEDFALWARVALKHSIAYLNKTLVYYCQDVDIRNRAVGGFKIWEPAHHYIFQINKIEEAESSNPDLKVLLDKMRLYSLFRYHIKGVYKDEVKIILDKVDFPAQTLSWKLKYNMPLLLVRTWFRLKKWGSYIKSSLIKIKG